MARVLPSVLASLTVLLCWQIVAASTLDDAALWEDDECARVPGGEACSLNALQLKGRASQRTKRAFVQINCHDAVDGEACFRDVLWAKRHGIHQHPNWYPGLTAESSLQDFQMLVHKSQPGKCPAPCVEGQSDDQAVQLESTTNRPRPAMPIPPLDPDSCLCVFDIDRTLTARQGTGGGKCAKAQEVPGVEDNAYFGGTLVLSEVAMRLKETFCQDCYLGLCSHGNANFEYSGERKVLLSKVLQGATMQGLVLRPQTLQWSDEQLLTPFVVYSPDEYKQLFVERILMWYQRQGINITRDNTWFFDDRLNNVLPFNGTGMNARQISCASRDMEIGDGAVGYCGASLEEIVKERGVIPCEANAEQELDTQEDEVEAKEASSTSPKEKREIPDEIVAQEHRTRVLEASAT